MGAFAPDFPAREIEVDDGVAIVCGFWVVDQQLPTILYFHGNGETVPGHVWIAPLYNDKGINLFVAEYRGYGASGGKPTIASMLADSHPILRALAQIVRREGLADSLFLMGRSLGSIPAIELAASHQDDVRGLIIESGSASSFRRLRDTLGEDPPGRDDVSNRVDPLFLRHPLPVLVPIAGPNQIVSACQHSPFTESITHSCLSCSGIEDRAH